MIHYKIQTADFMEEKMKIVVLITMLALIGSIFALSSYTDSGLISLDTVLPQLDLLSPDGGESWYIGDIRDIIWTASDPHLAANSVDLWYSLNGGSTYLPLSQSIANSGSYAWELPSIQSYNVRIRLGISDTFGNQSLVNSANPFSITYVPPAIPTAISVTSTNNIDALITWDAVTHTIPPYNSPITPDGYIVLYNESPYEHDEHFYYFLGRSYTTSYTHHDVIEFRDQMFYKVLAYKNYSREESLALEKLLQTKRDKAILWQDALQILRKGGR